MDTADDAASCFILTLFNSREINVLHNSNTPKEGLKNIKRTVLNRSLICNYGHQNSQNDPKVGNIFIVHYSFKHVLSYMSVVSIDESNPEILLTPTQSSFCLVQIKEERPGSTNRCDVSLDSRRVFGRQKFQPCLHQ